MEYPYLGFRNEDGSGILSNDSVVVFFTSENQGVVVHSASDKPADRFGSYGPFNEDDFYFYPEKNTVILQN